MAAQRWKLRLVFAATIVAIATASNVVDLGDVEEEAVPSLRVRVGPTTRFTDLGSGSGVIKKEKKVVLAWHPNQKVTYSRPIYAGCPKKRGQKKKGKKEDFTNAKVFFVNKWAKDFTSPSGKLPPQAEGPSIAVRCCKRFEVSGKVGCTSKTMPRDCEKLNGKCNGVKCLGKQKSFFLANTKCSKLGRGWRLCTKKELDSEVCCGTGCRYNRHYVWVRGAPTYHSCPSKRYHQRPTVTLARPDAIRIESRSPPPGASNKDIVVRCCDSASEKPTEFKCTSTTLSRARTVIVPSADGSGIEAVPGKATIRARSSGSGISLATGSARAIEGKCLGKAKTFPEAKSTCRKLGAAWRLCSKAQLDTGNCCSKHCAGYDDSYTWINFKNALTTDFEQPSSTMRPPKPKIQATPTPVPVVKPPTPTPGKKCDWTKAEAAIAKGPQGRPIYDGCKTKDENTFVHFMDKKLKNWPGTAHSISAKNTTIAVRCCRMAAKVPKASSGSGSGAAGLGKGSGQTLAEENYRSLGESGKVEKELQCTSKAKGRCLGMALNRKDAAAACAKVPGEGWKLCSKEQIDTGKCCDATNGCGYDDYNVWIRGMPTYDGCHRPTDPPAEITLALPEAKNVSTAPVNPPGATSRRIGVRCCRTTGSCLQCTSKNSDGKCLAGTGGSVGLTRRDASKACRDMGDGWNLCSKAQINTGKCCGTGCNYDNHYIWIQSGGATSRLTNDPLKPKDGAGKSIKFEPKEENELGDAYSNSHSEVSALDDFARSENRA